MRDLGLQGARRGRTWVRTTVGDDTLDRPADLVERQFTAPAPNRLWLADLTYVKTHSGWVYVGFSIDVYSRFIVGWQASRSAEIGSGDRRLGDGRPQSQPERQSRRSGPSLRSRGAISIGPLHRPARRQRHCRLGRLERRQLRQLHGRKLQRALQVGADLPARNMAGTRRRRMGTLEYVDWFNHRRLHGDHPRSPIRHPGGVRSRLLPSNRPAEGAGTQTNQPL